MSNKTRAKIATPDIPIVTCESEGVPEGCRLFSLLDLGKWVMERVKGNFRYKTFASSKF